MTSYLLPLISSLVALVMSTGCLNAQFLKPARGSVTLEVDGSAIPADMKPFLKGLRLTMHKSDALKPVTVSKEFALDEKDMSLNEVPVGTISAKLEVLSNTGSVVGTSSKDVTIATGANQISFEDVKVDISNLKDVKISVNVQIPAEYKALIASAKTRKLKFTRNGKDEKEMDLTASASTALAVPANVASLVSDNCVGCHDSLTASAKLDLSKYPYQSAKISDQAALLKKIQSRIKDGARPMPEDGLMEAATIALYDSFLTSALQPSTGVAAVSDAMTATLTAQIGEKLEGKIIIKDSNDNALLEGQLTAATVAKDLSWVEVKEWKQIPLPTGQVTVRARLVPNSN